MSTIKRCDECGKDINQWGGLTISPTGNSVVITVGGAKNGPADLCDWQCVQRYAEKRGKGTNAVVTYNGGNTRDDLAP